MFTISRYHVASALSCPLCYPASPAKTHDEECIVASSPQARRTDAHAAAVECVETLHPHRPVDVQELLERIAAIEDRLAEGRRTATSDHSAVTESDRDGDARRKLSLRDAVGSRRSASMINATVDVTSDVTQTAASPERPSPLRRAAVSLSGETLAVGADPSRLSLLSEGDHSRTMDSALRVSGSVVDARADTLIRSSCLEGTSPPRPTAGNVAAHLQTDAPQHPSQRRVTAAEARGGASPVAAEVLLAAVLRERFGGFVDVADALTDLVVDLMCDEYATAVQRACVGAFCGVATTSSFSPKADGRTPAARDSTSDIVSFRSLLDTRASRDSRLFESAYARFLEAIDAARAVLAEHQLGIAAAFRDAVQSLVSSRFAMPKREASAQNWTSSPTSEPRRSDALWEAGIMTRLRERVERHVEILEELTQECQESQLDTYCSALWSTLNSWQNRVSRHVPHPPTSRPIRKVSVERQSPGSPVSLFGHDDVASHLSLLEQIYDHCENRKRYWFTEATSRAFSADWLRAPNPSPSPTAAHFESVLAAPSVTPASAATESTRSALVPRDVTASYRRLTLRMEGLQQILHEYLDDYQERVVDTFQSALQCAASVPKPSSAVPSSAAARETPSADRSVSLTHAISQHLPAVADRLPWLRESEYSASRQPARSDSPDPQPEAQPPPSQHAARPHSYAAAATSKRGVRTSTRKHRDQEQLLQPPWNRSTVLDDRPPAPNSAAAGSEIRSRSNSARRAATAKYSAALQQQRGQTGVADADSVCRPTSSFLESASLRFRVAYWDRHRHVTEGHCRHCADHWCEELNLH